MILFLTALCFADDQVPLMKGEVAPYSGILLSNTRIAEIISNAEEKEILCRIDSEKQKKLADSKIKFEKDISKLRIDYLEENLQLCNATVEELDNRLKFKRAAFIGGLTLGLVAGYTSVWLASQL
jgi:hypothetical protein